MKTVTILSGAGINQAIAACCPQANSLANLTYQKISENVYGRLPPSLKALFTPDSFDYILGGLLTINIAIEKTKQDLNKFKVDPKAFCKLFGQPELQDSIIVAFSQIEEQLKIDLSQQLEINTVFDPSIHALESSYDTINYFTLNFDSVFDRIIYGKRYSRKVIVTDFWSGSGEIIKDIQRKFKIYRIHGYLKYKPIKVTLNNPPKFKWPVVVVGDHYIKKGMLAAHPALNYYNELWNSNCTNKLNGDINILAVVGFGFREVDIHIYSEIDKAVNNNVFDKIYLYSPEDKMTKYTGRYEWKEPSEFKLTEFLDFLSTA